MRIFRSLRLFLSQEEAPTMFEYALLVFFIALVVVAGASVLGVSISGVFETTAGSL